MTSIIDRPPPKDLALDAPADGEQSPRLGKAFQLVLAVGVGLLVVWFVLGPIGTLIKEAVWDGDSFNLHGIREAYTAFGIGSIFKNAFLFALATTVVALVQGTLLAWLAARTNAPCQRLLFAAAVVPLVVPPVLSTLAWIYLASPRTGILNYWLDDAFGGPTLNIFSMVGMVFVESQHLVPLVFLLIYAALRSTDPALEESALMSGASRATVVRRVTLPMVAPAIYAAIVILVVRSLESFEVPALLGLPRGLVVFTSRIWRALGHYPADTDTATAYSLLLLLVCVAGMAIYGRMTQRHRKSYQTVTGKGFRSATMDLGRSRWPFGVVIVLYFVVSVILPVAVLAYSSLQPYYRPPTWGRIADSTLANYSQLFRSDAIVASFRNSIVLALGTATAIILVMSLAAWIVNRTTVRGRRAIDHLVTLPLGVPGIVLGFAMLSVYIGFPVHVYATIWILFIAYFTRFMPYGMRYVSTSLMQIGAELEESARMSGASWLQIFRRILFPLMLPGILAGWIYIVTVSLRELSSSLLLYSPGNEVLSITVWEMWSNGGFTVVAALGVVMTLVLLILVQIARRISARYGMEEL